jgi:photosystem II stability/assembly factor-like uncharacterized protein
MKNHFLVITLLVILGALANTALAQTWTAQTSGLTTSLNTVSTVNQNVCWIGGNGGVVLRTINGGVNWTNVTGSPIGTSDVYAICGLDANTCLVSTSPAATFVFKTTNAGANWTQVFTQTGGFIDDIKFQNATTGFMYGDPVGARWSLWKTTNAGTTWDSAGLYLPQVGTEAGWNNAMYVNGTTIMFGTNNTKIYKSTNFGTSWTSSATTGTANTYSVSFNGTTGFAGESAAVKSTDGGTTFSAFTVPGTGSIYSFNNAAGKFWYGRGASIYGSTDNGGTFASQFTGTGTYQAMSVKQDGLVVRGWCVSNGGGIVIYNETLPLPVGWTAQTSGLTTSLNTVSTVNQNVCWIGGNGGVVLRTTNAGSTWTNVTGAPIGTSDVYAICGLDANTCLVSTSPAATFVFKTTNAGANWTQVFTQTGGFIDDIKFQNATTGFMYGDPVGARWSLWKTTDAGSTWDSAGLYLPQVGTEAGWNNAMYVNGTTIMFGTNNTKIYKSTNFGTSWTSSATTGTANTYSVAFSGTTGFAGESAAVKSTDGGTTFSAFTVPGTGSIYSFNAVLTRFWYGRGASIYGSTDNGGTFAAQYTGTGTYQAMSVKQDGNIIRGFCVSNGGGIVIYNDILTGIVKNQNEIPANFSLSQNYPNPFNPSTKINFNLPKSGNVTLKVYDILGSEVATLVDESLNAGTYNIDWNASSLSSGVYFYRLQTGDFTDTKKMMLVK